MKKIISIVLALVMLLPAGVFATADNIKQISLADIAFMGSNSLADSTDMSIFKFGEKVGIKYLNKDKMNEFLTLLDQQFILVETEDNVLAFGDYNRDDTYEINFLNTGILGSVYIQNGMVAKYGSFMSSFPNFKYKFLNDYEGVRKLIETFYEQGDDLMSQSTTYSGKWSVGTVEEAKNLGIVPESFGTNYAKSITREEFCDLAYNTLERAIGLEWSAIPEIMPFADTNDMSVFTLYSKGIINGKSKTEFAPNDLLTREEAATILDRMAGYLKITKQPIGEYKYADAELFSDWAVESINNMFELNIMVGTGDNLFDPSGSYTRDQAIATMLRIFSKVQDDKVTTFADSLNRLMPTDGNYMFSPLSIKMALAMAATGAQGETKDEILKALKIDDLGKFNQFAKQLIKEYSENQNVKLNIANSLWLNTDYYKDVDFEAVFKSAISSNYDADSEKVNNVNAVGKINNWVNDKTNGKIKELVSDSDFLAYIVNAIYFKGEWAVQFSESATKKSEFTDRNNYKNQIDFMNMTGYFDYYGDKYVQMIRLPYKDEKTSMYIALSSYRESELVSKISKMENKRVQISLPKFKTEFGIELINSLLQIGINTAFTPEKADFKSMFTDTPKNIFISDVIHKTFIKVDENGTEAAAATGVGGGGSSMTTELPTIFNANKPFSYFIRDDVNGEILFMGEYAYAE